jgi:hypothetical protein
MKYVDESSFLPFREAVQKAVLLGEETITFNGYTQQVAHAVTVVDFLSKWYVMWDDAGNPRIANPYYEVWQTKKKSLVKKAKELAEVEMAKILAQKPKGEEPHGLEEVTDNV